MNDRYHFEALGDRIKLCVSPEHKFGTDAFLLSDFAAPRRKDRACDLGTGCGIVALAWYRTEETRPRQSYGVDIQPQAIDQLTITVRENDLEGQVVPVLADLTDRSALPEGQSFDVVTCNPPYKIEGRGILSETGSDQIARHETACTIDDVCRAAAWLLRFGGRCCICQRPERLPDVMEQRDRTQTPAHGAAAPRHRPLALPAGGAQGRQAFFAGDAPADRRRRRGLFPGNAAHLWQVCQSSQGGTEKTWVDCR